MAYIGQADLEYFLGVATVFELFNDNNAGVVSVNAVNQVCSLASARLDGKLARVYTGPFPVTQQPVPDNIKMGTLLYAKALAYQRRPEYVKQYKDAPMKEADAFAEELCQAREYIPDYLAQPTPANVGTIVSDGSPRIIADGPDGANNGGDY